jgi:lipocalin
VLSRTPQLDEAQWGAVTTELQRLGFDLQRLKREAAPRE